jgi:uncharacterized protein YbjT (DUF2867 family)
MTLVVGSTGLLGGEIAKQLRARGHEVRALVRVSSRRENVEPLERAGAELIVGDLKDPQSLVRACAGVECVVSTATCTNSRGEGDGVESVDGAGQRALIGAAREAGVKQLVFVSFPSSKLDYPLQSAKRAAEARLRESSLTFTILQPTFFFEPWFSAALGFNWQQRSVQLFGGGDAKNSYVSFRDVARVAVGVIGNPAASNRTLAFGGPERMSRLDGVRLFEELTGAPFRLDTIPAEALEAQCAARADPLEWSFAAMMLSCGVREEFALGPEALEGVVDLAFESPRALAAAAVRGG